MLLGSKHGHRQSPPRMFGAFIITDRMHTNIYLKNRHLKNIPIYKQRQQKAEKPYTTSAYLLTVMKEKKLHARI